MANPPKYWSGRTHGRTHSPITILLAVALLRRLAILPSLGSGSRDEDATIIPAAAAAGEEEEENGEDVEDVEEELLLPPTAWKELILPPSRPADVAVKPSSR